MDNVNSEGNNFMNFTNEEIMSYLVKPLKKHPNICVKALTLDEKRYRKQMNKLDM